MSSKNLTIDQVNARRPRCARCGCLGDIAWTNDPKLRETLLRLDSNDDVMAFFSTVRQHTGCGLGEAKALRMHLANPNRTCHRCGEPLSDGEVVDCAKCQSVNIVWAT